MFESSPLHLIVNQTKIRPDLRIMPNLGINRKAQLEHDPCVKITNSWQSQQSPRDPLREHGASADMVVELAIIKSGCVSHVAAPASVGVCRDVATKIAIRRRATAVRAANRRSARRRPCAVADEIATNYSRDMRSTAANRRVAVELSPCVRAKRHASTLSGGSRTKAAVGRKRAVVRLVAGEPTAAAVSALCAVESVSAVVGAKTVRAAACALGIIVADNAIPDTESCREQSARAGIAATSRDCDVGNHRVAVAREYALTGIAVHALADDDGFGRIRTKSVDPALADTR